MAVWGDEFLGTGVAWGRSMGKTTSDEPGSDQGSARGGDGIPPVLYPCE